MTGHLQKCQMLKTNVSFHYWTYKELSALCNQLCLRRAIMDEDSWRGWILHRDTKVKRGKVLVTFTTSDLRPCGFRNDDRVLWNSICNYSTTTLPADLNQIPPSLSFNIRFPNKRYTEETATSLNQSEFSSTLQCKDQLKHRGSDLIQIIQSWLK